MQGTSLSKQECKYMLYNEFDKFSYVKGEILHQYYLWFAQLINDINIIQMTMQPVQVNIKFPNNLPPEWGKFMTDVKLARDFHTLNYHKLYAYLEHHEYQQQLSPPIQRVYSTTVNLYGAAYHLHQYQTTYPTNLSHTQPSVPQNTYPPLIIPQQPQAEFPQLYSGLEVPTFLPGDDPIACSEWNTLGLRGNTSGQVKVVKCYNYQGEGHMAKDCTHPKRIKDATWFKEKLLFVQAHAEGKELDEEQLAFLADLGVADGQVAQTITHNTTFQTDDLDAYDSDCDDISSAKVVLMYNLSSSANNVFGFMVCQRLMGRIEDVTSRLLITMHDAVIVDGLEHRFCQQCIQFHGLPTLDGKNRRCHK
nr:squamosa promoter-binding-like protein 2 [Tanacetum cinerariifolium]